ncbi:hypothetical protein ACOSQ2_004405 [Xanthoceras sorbifolium]
MEEDLTSEMVASLMFDFDFDKEVDLIDNPFSHAHPSNQPNPTTPGNVSHEHVDQLVSSSGSNPTMSIPGQNLTGATDITTTENLNCSPEISPNITLPNLSFVIPDSTTEISLEPQPPLDRVNTNRKLPGQAHISQGRTNQPLLSAAPNNISLPVTSSFNTPFSGALRSHFPTTEEASPRIDELLCHQPMSTPPLINLSNSLLDHQQLAQNVGVSTHNQQAIPYPTSFPQINPTGLRTQNGRSQIHQQRAPATCLPNYYNLPHNRPPSSLSRPQHLAIQQQTLNNQLPGNVYNPQYPYIMVPANSTFIRPQQFVYQLNLVPVAPNSQNHNIMLPVPSLPILRPPPVPYQSNQVSLPPTVGSSQGHRPIMLAPTTILASRPPNYQAVVAPNNPNMPRNSIMVPRGHELNDPNQQFIRGQVNGNVSDYQPMLPSQLLMHPGQSVTYPSRGSSQLNQDLNSSIGHQAFPGRQHQQQQQQQRRERRSRYEAGESSSAAKRARRDSIRQESSPQALAYQSQEDGGDNSLNTSRPVKNSLYDPIYETIGLPIDPHLRIFTRMN